jgi:FixJ family two-component response regulator
MHLIQFLPSESKTIDHGFALLKQYEWKVLVLIVDDFTNSQIMTALSLKRRTVLNIRNSIGDKLGLKGVHTLAVFSRANRDLILTKYNSYRSNQKS